MSAKALARSGLRSAKASVQRAVQVALVGRYFERIADHSVNMAERVWYMVTGHLYSSDPDAPPAD